MKRLFLRAILVCCGTIAVLSARTQADTLVQLAADTLPRMQLQSAELGEYSLRAGDQTLIFEAADLNGTANIILNQEEKALDFQNGRAEIPYPADRAGKLLLLEAGEEYSLYHLSLNRDNSPRLRHIPLWLSILPPLVAIGLALIFKEVFVSLFIGIWVGSFIAGGLRIDSLYYLLMSVLGVVQHYILAALNSTSHLSVLVFSLLIGGMVAIISRNGGMAGVVARLSRYARDDRSAQGITWLLGVAIFFDDYANTLIVGNTMRPVTDRFRVSREKLAYIVDSTAAPVAAVAFITTWIGAELGYIDDGISQLSNWPAELTPYAVFIESLKYAFYPILTLLFMLFLIYGRRDYGPMHQAEVRARTTGQVGTLNIEEGDDADQEFNPAPGAPLKARNAVIPVLVVIFMTIYGLVDTGLASIYGSLAEAGAAPATSGWGATWGAMGALWEGGVTPSFFMKLGRVIGAADSYVALLWASLSGVIVALLLTIGGRIMSLERTIGTLTNGFKTMLPALMILTLAWSLAATTEQLHTATFLTEALRGSLSPFLLPPLIFILAGMISFSTGSSWSTMAILYPIAIPLTWAIAQSADMDYDHSLELMFNVIAVVLSASVLGDHCSPISDTTILSSLASNCNHIDHVRTQLPYALTVGGVSLLLCFLSTFFDGAWGLSLVLFLIGMVVLFGVVRLVGKPVPIRSEE